MDIHRVQFSRRWMVYHGLVILNIYIYIYIFTSYKAMIGKNKIERYGDTD